MYRVTQFFLPFVLLQISLFCLIRKKMGSFWYQTYHLRVNVREHRASMKRFMYVGTKYFLSQIYDCRIVAHGILSTFANYKKIIARGVFASRDFEIFQVVLSLNETCKLIFTKTVTYYIFSDSLSLGLYSGILNAKKY